MSWLTKRLRLRAALMMAAVYALCVVAPPVALAFTDGAVAAHCLFEDLDGSPHVHSQSAQKRADAHTHASGTAHDRIDATAPIKSGGETQGNVVACCGLFCVPAIFGNQPALLADHVSNSPIFPAIEDRLAGRGPDRLNRPPKAL